MTLQEHRKELKLSETELARRAGLSRFGVRRIEGGAATTTESLERIAQALNKDFITIVSAWQNSKKVY